MTYKNHGRRSTHLKGYDYTQAGVYFVTLCEHERACVFGDVVERIRRYIIENPLRWDLDRNHPDRLT